MRPGQKNRMRGGRGGNSSSNAGGSRRGPNPLTRSYESNGPDVKVRGTPQHIAEKYVQLARDSHTAGDIVMAESYLQHAEHYYRIISAAHNAQQVAYNQSMGIQNTAADDAQSDEDEYEVVGADRFTFQAPQVFQPPGQNAGQQPYAPSGGQPYDPSVNGEQPPMGDMPVMEGAQPNYQPNQQPRGDRPYGNRRPFGDRGERSDRGDRQERPERQDRPERQERPDRQDRPERQERPDRPEGERQERGPRRFGRDRNFGDRSFGDRNNGEPRPQGERSGYAPRQPDAGVSADFAGDAQPVLPSFITAPVRPVAAEMPEPAAPRFQEAPRLVEAVADTALKVRRRRRVRNADGELVDSSED